MTQKSNGLNQPKNVESLPKFTPEEIKKLSKIRIIQKNLVHFLGFPDELYDTKILSSYAYFGQYGLIKKIELNVKNEELTKNHKNSAYITFDNKNQAAYAILVVDLIKINDQTVRAFFGTTKYCSHFLNNRKCYNQDKCVFIHKIVSDKEIIKESEKFGYNEHIKLAKKIIRFNSPQSRSYVMSIIYYSNTVLPKISSIYLEKNNQNEDNENCEKENIILSNYNKKNGNKKIISNINDDEFPIFHWKKKSRFFDIKTEISKKNVFYISNNLKLLIDNLTKRLSFCIIFNIIYKYFCTCKDNTNIICNDSYSNTDYSWDYFCCKKIYEETHDDEIKFIMEKSLQSK